MNFRWLGSVPYDAALELQAEAHARVRAGAPDDILGLEHPAVVTLGVRGEAAHDLVNVDGLPVVRTDRGGQATLHSPGQLVIYPIMDLRRRRLSAREFVRLLLTNTAKILGEHGIPAEAREESAGVYTPAGKIAFCGLRIDRGVSRHGISINVSNEIGLFHAIRPCGANASDVVSWKNFREPPALPTIFTHWVERLNGLL